MRPTLTLALFAGSVLSSPARPAQQLGTLADVSGTVLDLSPSSAGELYYCTAEGDIGRISAAGTVTVLAGPAELFDPPRAVAETPAGDLAVADYSGDIFVLPAGGGPPVQVYADTYLVREPTDLLVDANGTYVLASKTPTNGVSALDWASADGAAWAYYLVAHEPVALAADPLGPGLVFSDAQAGGGLRAIAAADEAHASSPLDLSTPYGFSTAAHDGDLAVEADGDVLAVGGGKLFRFAREAGTATVLASGLGTLRGLAIAPSSGGVPSATGWSAYIAEGAGPTAIRELGGVDAPAPQLAADLGKVPDRGYPTAFVGSVKAYELATDLDGNLLLGGDHFSGNKLVQRMALPSLALSTVVDSAKGLASRVEGVVHAPDGTYYLATHDGAVLSFREGDPAVQVVLDPAANDVEIGKDLAYSRDGALWVADREGYGYGEIVRVDPSGQAIGVTATFETRGLAGDPFTGRLLAAIWNDEGFAGTVEALDPLAPQLAPLSGFAGMNYTNAGTWADGDLALDVLGRVYTCAEDDFSVHRYDPASGALVRIGAGYKNRLSGVAIARSSAAVTSSTGWSLYVSEFNYLWEHPGVPAPAPLFVDPLAPPVGRVAGWLPATAGTPRALAVDPLGGGLIVSTSAGRVLRIDISGGAAVEVAGPAQGISGDLVALSVRKSGAVLAARPGGAIFELHPHQGWSASLLFTDPLDKLSDVRGIAVDAENRPVISDGASPGAGRLWRLESGALVPLARTAGGLRPALDPLTGELFVAEGGGEVLRVDAAASPPRHGHHGAAAFETFAFGEKDGGIALDGDGNLYLAEGDTGRAERIDRATGARDTLGGGYGRPLDLALAPGTPGVAGAQGASLFVLDGFAVYEHGIDAPLPSAPSGSGGPPQLGVHGELVLGGTTPFSIASPPDAGRIYVLVPTFSGKSPGLPLSSLGDPGDPRVLPANLDFAFGYVGDPTVLPLAVGVLDQAGASPAGMGLVFPSDPALLGADTFLDLTFVALDPLAQSGIATVGATAQVWIGS